MKEENELPYIEKPEILSAEFRRLKSERLKTKEKKQSFSTSISKRLKTEIFELTNGVCHICGVHLTIDNFSITTAPNAESEIQKMPACLSCKKIYDKYLPDEIRWAMKIGLWIKTQIEFETELGKEIALRVIEEEKYRESKRKNKRTPLQIDLQKFPLKQNFVVGSTKLEYQKIKEVLYWSYASLGMAHKALKDNAERYNRLHYVIRKKSFNGFINGTMNPRSLFHDEKSKLESDKCCVYCGKNRLLQIDHIIPKKKGGKDSGENLVWACRNCNASKNDNDLMEWYSSKQEFPPLRILRNYLKLVIQYCVENSLMEEDLDTSAELNLPFKIEFIPLDFPQPNSLKLRYEIQ
jgi:5-methylcytosine-specific restriction endonuclease McrA